MMVVTFKVTGHTADEIRLRADEKLREFGAAEPTNNVVSADFDVYPQAESYQGDTVVWEADVRAVIAPGEAHA